jgi:F0F1-type ATP synthase assembly protein I
VVDKHPTSSSGRPSDPGQHQSAPADSGLGLWDLMGLGGLLVGAVVIFTAIGWGLDAALGSSPALVLAGLAVGIAAGIVGCWLRIKAFLT